MAPIFVIISITRCVHIDHSQKLMPNELPMSSLFGVLGVRHTNQGSAGFFFCGLYLYAYSTFREKCLYHFLELLMADTLPELLDSRSHLLQELSQLGDFQPGSISSVHRRCGKPNCHCAQPHDPGHGPLRRLTQKIAGKALTQTLSSPSAVRKAEKEIAEFRR